MERYATEIKWGGIFTVVTLAWMVLEKAMGWHDELIAQHPTYTNLFAILAIAVYVAALLEKRKRDLGGYMTWLEGFKSGMRMTLVIAILNPLVQILTHSVISPEYFAHAIDYAVSSGNMDLEQAEAYFSMESYLLQGGIGALLMGLITSVIVALALQRKVPSSE